MQSITAAGCQSSYHLRGKDMNSLLVLVLVCVVGQETLGAAVNPDCASMLCLRCPEGEEPDLRTPACCDCKKVKWVCPIDKRYCFAPGEEKCKIDADGTDDCNKPGTWKCCPYNCGTQCVVPIRSGEKYDCYEPNVGTMMAGTGRTYTDGCNEYTCSPDGRVSVTERECAEINP